MIIELNGITVRPARREELEQINGIRRMVNDLHTAGRPDIFRPGFCTELKKRIYDLFEKEDWLILAAVDENSRIVGFASIQYMLKPESPYNLARRIYHVEEFGVSTDYQRRGAGTALFAYMKQDAKEKGYDRIELDYWQFNEGAEAFYTAVGFQTYRKFAELYV